MSFSQMNESTVDSWLLKVASGLDRNVCGRRRNLKSVGRTCRMIAALHALKSFGMAEKDNSDDDDRGNWRPTEVAYELMQLEECGAFQTNR
jgi:hypothetical protein